MMYALNLSEDSRILSATYPQFAAADAVIVEKLPDGNIYEYRYVNGEYIHDPLPEPVQPEDPAQPENPETEASVWDELDAAYQKGVDSV